MSTQFYSIKLAKKKEVLEPLLYEKYFVIEPYGNAKVIFKAIDLTDEGRMERSAEANWKQLLKIIKDQLKLTDTSTFLFIKKDNPDDQIDNDGDLMDVWNELNKSRKAMYYTLKMVRIIYIFLIIK
ncbi:hypothetical protein RFI_36354 [Reticulomyxa filosa]|uniref:Uncharacterized protein n=1 Tax=Reticulomyxa filosa TaxID=46433 RepID=X6LI90_RETFI|nr:hypothetical protein RFI_36354 [Reticulomyxa filosa]|eukprot:ETO01086.1 hypothetical protein RFI_36354 [Reticulomyxa filosa]